jgi:hypothetical protein
MQIYTIICITKTFSPQKNQYHLLIIVMNDYYTVGSIFAFLGLD